MGTWDYQPWANDKAADWYADVMEETNLREKWLSGIEADPVDNLEVVRAAAWLFIQLGHTYIWPISNLDEDLEQTITALRNLLESEDVAEDPELVDAVTVEIADLESRR